MKLENNVLTINDIEYPTLRSFFDDYSIDVRQHYDTLVQLINDYANKNTKEREFQYMEQFTLLTWNDFGELPMEERRSVIEAYCQQKNVITSFVDAAIKMAEMITGTKPSFDDLNIGELVETEQLTYVHDHEDKHTLNITL